MKIIFGGVLRCLFNLEPPFQKTLATGLYFPSYHKHKKTAITYCAFYSVHKFSPKSHLRPNPPLWIL